MIVNRSLQKLTFSKLTMPNNRDVFVPSGKIVKSGVPSTRHILNSWSISLSIEKTSFVRCSERFSKVFSYLRRKIEELQASKQMVNTAHAEGTKLQILDERVQSFDQEGWGVSLLEETRGSPLTSSKLHRMHHHKLWLFSVNFPKMKLWQIGMSCALCIV